MKRQKLVIIGSEPWSLIHFRGHLIKAIKNAGHTVLTVSNKIPDHLLRDFEDNHVDHVHLNFYRGGKTPFKDIRILLKLIFLFLRERPDYVIGYTIKPVIWGGFAAMITRTSFYPIITGLGYTFNGTSLSRRLLKHLVITLYRGALSKAAHIFFQNPDNMQTFLNHRLVTENNSSVVNGSGVDLLEFSLSSIPNADSKFTFLCICRLLREKGLREYFKAAEIIKKKYPDVNFFLVGPPDDSPDGIPVDEVNAFVEKGIINYFGECSDVRTFIEQCHVYVLPSYHEGIPRSTLEAMGLGRPILTTDAVGCRETVINNINGFKVPVGDSLALAEKMSWFLKNQDKLVCMGFESRQIVEEKFDVHHVNRQMMDIIGL